MSQMSSVRIMGIAAALTLVAAPFAIGGELPTWLRKPVVASATTVISISSAPEATGGRIAKSDRIAVTARTSGPTRTFSVQPSDLKGTSILVRVPDRLFKREATDSPPSMIKPREAVSKPRAACEPVVSVLTDVAKQLGPGRCIT